MGKHFHYIVPVWGEQYVRLFTDICLPMLIGYSGIRESVSPQDKFIIATTWHDRHAILQTSAYQQLCQLMPIEFILIDGLVNLKDTYHAMSYCYMAGMQNADVKADKTYFIFLTPDSFWTEGMFSRLAKLRDQHYKVAMAIGIRLSLEPMLPFYLDIVKQSQERRIHLPFHQVINQIMQHMHPMVKSSDLLSKNGFPNQWPSNLCWINTEKNQMVVHGFHLHPIMVKAPPAYVPMGDTLDGKFLKNLNYPLNDFYIFQNRHFGLELTANTRKWHVNLEPASIDKIIDFSFMHASDVHLHFFKHRLIIGEEQEVDPILDRLITQTIEKIITVRSNRKRVLIYTIKQIIKRKCKTAALKVLRLAGSMKCRFKNIQSQISVK